MTLQEDNRVLYVCAQGVIRSRTAEVLTLLGGIQARSCGTDSDALVPASNTLATWAHVIVCMKPEHHRHISEFMGSEGKPVLCLDLPDTYRPFQPKLIRDLVAGMAVEPKLQIAILDGLRSYERAMAQPNTIEEPKHKRAGRPLKGVTLGVAKDLNIVRTLIEAVPTRAKLDNTDWTDARSVQETWEKFIKAVQDMLRKRSTAVGAANKEVGMSRYFRLRMSTKLAEAFEKEVQKPGYGPRKKALWIGEALARLEEDDPNLQRVGLGDEIDTPRDCNIGVKLTRESFQLLELMSRRVREVTPLMEGVRAQVVRTAIRHRVHEAG